MWNANYANIVHNDLNDNSGRVRCRELLTKNLRNFRAPAATTRRNRPTRRCRGGSCRSTSPSRWRPWASTPSCSAPPPPALFRGPAVYHQLPHLRRPRRRDHPLHLPPQPRVVLVTPAEGDRASRCSSATIPSPTVPSSRWSFHTSCIDPTAPDDAPCRKNLVVRSFCCLLLRRQDDTPQRERLAPSTACRLGSPTENNRPTSR